MKFKAKEIADELGISPSTVSLVLNGKSSVKGETRQKIFDLIEKKGFDLNELYTPNRELNDTILVIIYLKFGHLLFDTSFLDSVFEGVSRYANALGYEVTVYHHYEKKSSMRALQQKINSIRPAGIVLVATEMNQTDLQAFVNFKLPVVLLDRTNGGLPIDAVCMDNYNGVASAIRYLYEKGHRSIGAIFTPTTVQNIFERRMGFIAAMQEMGLPVQEEFFWDGGDYLGDAFAKIKARLETHPQLPSAFFAANDIIGSNAIQAFRLFGIRIPEDISIIGFDNTTISEVVTPQLTTVAAYKRRMGELAVQRVDNLIKMPIVENVNISVNTRLICRDSVRDISNE